MFRQKYDLKIFNKGDNVRVKSNINDNHCCIIGEESKIEEVKKNGWYQAYIIRCKTTGSKGKMVKQQINGYDLELVEPVELSDVYVKPIPVRTYIVKGKIAKIKRGIPQNFNL